MPRKKKLTPEELMQMAIEESRSSIHDHSDRMDRLVGAIITTADGEILARAHRCELRVGEHCEYTLIERKLVNENLRGCVLYVTLEPCTDSSRGLGKRGCSTRIVRARLGKVYVGIQDPDPRIAGNGIEFLRQNQIPFEMFPERLQDSIRSDNSQFIREREEQAKQVEGQEAEEPQSILQKVAPGTKISSLSSSTLHQFIKTASKVSAT
jgi:ATP-dependent DNA helicase RecG